MPELVTKSIVAPVASCSKIVRFTPSRSTKERFPLRWAGKSVLVSGMEEGKASERHGSKRAATNWESLKRMMKETKMFDLKFQLMIDG